MQRRMSVRKTNASPDFVPEQSPQTSPAKSSPASVQEQQTARSKRRRSNSIAFDQGPLRDCASQDHPALRSSTMNDPFSHQRAQSTTSESADQNGGTTAASSTAQGVSQPLQLVPEDSASCVPTQRGYIEERTERMAYNAAGGIDDRTPVFQFTPKHGGCELPQVSPPKHPASFAPKLMHRQDKDTKADSDENSKSPKKSILDRLQFFKQKETRSQSSSDAVSDEHLPSPSAPPGVPPKAQAVLGTGAPTLSNPAVGVSRTTSKKKGFFHRRESDAGPARPSKIPLFTRHSFDKVQAPQDVSAILTDPTNRSSSIAGPKESLVHEWHHCQNPTDGDHILPPTPPAKDSPPGHAKAPETAITNGTAPSLSEAEAAFEAQFDDPFDDTSFGNREVPRLTTQRSVHSFHANIVPDPEFFGDDYLRTLKARVEGLDLECFDLPGEAQLRAPFAAAPYATVQYSPSLYDAEFGGFEPSPAPRSRGRRHRKRHTLDFVDLPTLMEERVKEEEAEKSDLLAKHGEAKEEGKITIGWVPSFKPKVSPPDPRIQPAKSALLVKGDDFDRSLVGEPGSGAVAGQDRSEPGSADQRKNDGKENAVILAQVTAPVDTGELLPSTVYVPPKESKRKSVPRATRSQKKKNNAAGSSEHASSSSVQAHDALLNTHDDMQSPCQPTREAQLDLVMNLIRQVKNEVVGSSDDNPLDNVLAILQNREHELRLMQSDMHASNRRLADRLEDIDRDRAKGTTIPSAISMPNMMFDASIDSVETTPRPQSRRTASASSQRSKPKHSRDPSNTSQTIKERKPFKQHKVSSFHEHFPPEADMRTANPSSGGIGAGITTADLDIEVPITPLRVDPLRIIKQRLNCGEQAPADLHEASQRDIQGRILSEARRAHRERREMRLDSLASLNSLDGGARLGSSELKADSWDQNDILSDIFAPLSSAEPSRRDVSADSITRLLMTRDPLDSPTRSGRAPSLSFTGEAVEAESPVLGRCAASQVRLVQGQRQRERPTQPLPPIPVSQQSQIQAQIADRRSKDGATGHAQKHNDEYEDQDEKMRGLQDANRRLQELYNGLARQVAEMQSSLQPKKE